MKNHMLDCHPSEAAEAITGKMARFRFARICGLLALFHVKLQHNLKTHGENTEYPDYMNLTHYLNKLIHVLLNLTFLKE